MEVIKKPNIIFLDIDGVLCVTRCSFDRFPCLLKRIDPIGIEFLNAFCYATNSKLVMSSTWRLGHDDFPLRAFSSLLTAGLKNKHIFYDDPITKDLPGWRGNEIQDWLDRNKDKYDKYMILDDDSDMLEHQMDRLIKTDGYNGILFEHMKDMCDLFNIDAKDLNQ